MEIRAAAEAERLLDSDVAVEVRGVQKKFDDFVALDGINLAVKRGEFVALVGPSGCGKSTLLRLIAGLITPTDGSVTIGGQLIEGTTHPQVSVMFQSPTLFPWRTVLANVLLPVEVQRAPSSEDKARAKQLLSMTGLTDFTEHYPSQLSGGMQQRVSLCRVLVKDPEIMLLDEPFGALDEFTREHLNVELANMVEDSTRSVVLVTHNISEAVFLSDRVITLGTNPGRILGDISIELPRPRSQEVVFTQAFAELTKAVRVTLGMHK